MEQVVLHSLLKPTRLILLLAAACLWAGCADPESSEEAAPQVKLPDQELLDYVIVDSRNGDKKWELHSERMEKFADADTARLHGVNMQFFRADTLFSTLVALDGRINQRSNDLFVWGDVVVTTTDGRILETQELYYDNATDLISNEVFDRIIEDGYVTTSIGIIVKPDMSWMQLNQMISQADTTESVVDTDGQ
jgi:LPS export ABC transporter protein LptC